MKVLFLGTPAFGIPSLQKIYESDKHSLLGVICQPDKETDRKGNVIYSPVKEFALAHNLPVYQFEKISRDGVDIIKKIAPDIMVTASYGQILSQEIIDIPKYGIINIHGSLLPKYRGAAPVQAAIINGETETGITIMRTEAGLDTGDIIKMQKLDILEDETAGELMERLGVLGAELLITVLGEIENGTATYTEQMHVDATITRKYIKKNSGLNFEKSAKELKCQILGLNPEPVAFSNIYGTMVNVYRAKVAPDEYITEELNGTIIPPTCAKRGLFVQCHSSVLEITELQFPGGKIITGKDAINGKKLKIGDRFETNIIE